MRAYNEDEMRATDCCGSHSTHVENGSLCCKTCWEEVSVGEGDGCDYQQKGAGFDVDLMNDYDVIEAHMMMRSA